MHYANPNWLWTFKLLIYPTFVSSKSRLYVMRAFCPITEVIHFSLLSLLHSSNQSTISRLDLVTYNVSFNFVESFWGLQFVLQRAYDSFGCAIITTARCIYLWGESEACIAKHILVLQVCRSPFSILSIDMAAVLIIREPVTPNYLRLTWLLFLNYLELQYQGLHFRSRVWIKAL